MDVSFKGNKAKFTAEDWFEKIESITARLRKLEPGFDDVCWITDNEPTMGSVRRKASDYGIEQTGCFAHGGNKMIGLSSFLFFTFTGGVECDLHHLHIDLLANNLTYHLACC